MWNVLRYLSFTWVGSFHLKNSQQMLSLNMGSGLANDKHPRVKKELKECNVTVPSVGSNYMQVFQHNVS